MDYNIEQEREKCIMCGACAGTCPDNWEMKEDGKSSPKKTSISEDELDCNMSAAQSCPVNIIHIKEDKEDGKQLI
ncbi:ferredoxin [Candidatus Woesearchaeota archaeon]|nr:ferredoxin [Candidatus Woesearchaeota archaeon]